MKNIKQYLNKEMEEQELDSFTKKLIQYRFDKKQKTIWAEKMEKELQITRSIPTLSTKKWRVWKYVTAIAASIAFLMMAFPVYQSNFNPTPQMIAMNLLTETIDKSGLGGRRKGNVEEPHLRAGMEIAFAEKEYSAATKFGEQLIEQGIAKSKDYYCVGLSFLHLKLPNKAIPKLKKVLEMDKNYQGESRWFLSLAYILNQEEEAGKKELQYIQEKGEWNKIKAKELLKALEK